jgi:hypothetical protein
MRTTLIIPDPLFRRAKAYAKKHDKKLSDLFSEALADRLARDDQSVREERPAYRVKPLSMGVASVDISDRESLNRIMDDRLDGGPLRKRS